MGSFKLGSRDTFKYQQRTTKPHSRTDLQIDGLLKVKKNILHFDHFISCRFRNTKLSTLSQINRKKFALCQELLRDPSVIFVDRSPIHPETDGLIENLKEISKLGKTVVCTLETSSFRLDQILLGGTVDLAV